MKITQTDIWKYSIPMTPFHIATGTAYYAQNLLVKLHTDAGLTGLGECSCFPMITGETQATCFAMASDFAALLKNQDADDIEARMNDLHRYAAFNHTVKSAFDMALYDLAAKAAGQPLYLFLGGQKKEMETDLTIGLDSPEKMADTAIDFVERGVRILKVKLGKEPREDIRRIQLIREAIGQGYPIRIDANQGWTFEGAATVLKALADKGIEFCEQPMRTWDDEQLPALRKLSPIPLMADESVFDHHDAHRLIQAEACDFVNIKMAKSGGILEATRINEVCETSGIACMMGGMLESRLALTAFAHFAAAHDNIRFYDMDTCMLGHLTDPVTGGLQFKNFKVQLPDQPGIGAGVDEKFLRNLETISV